MPFFSSSDITQPPFTVEKGTPAQTGQHMAALYHRLSQQQPLPILDIWQQTAQIAGFSPDSPFFKAGVDVAKDLEAGHGTGIAHGYHNTLHDAEVLLNTLHLIMRQADRAGQGLVLSPLDRGKLLFAALVHDFHYTSGGNKTPTGEPAPYRLERIAFTNARPSLERYGVTAADMDDIAVIIYGTDVSPASNAGHFVRAAHDFWFKKGEKPTVTPVLTPVAPLLENPHLAHMAALLGDADVLSSAGLSPENHQIQSQRLGAEWQKTMGPQDTLFFFDHVMGGRFTTHAAEFFQPNMDGIRKIAEQALTGTVANHAR